MAGLQNLTRVKAELETVIKRKLAAFARGLKKAGVMVQRASMQIVPVDYGNLRASAFTRAEGSGRRIKVIVGYTAAYAVFVHEDLDASHGGAFNAKYAKELAAAKALRKKRKGGTTGPFRHDRGPNQQAKFLEAPFRAMRGDIVRMVREEVAQA